jgi:catechol 2,3-dioxygenase-like lactoylglutathione lyase family enzyme
VTEPASPIHHLTLWVPDLARADESWTWLLGELGYRPDRSLDAVLLLRHPGGAIVALESSPDMVPGMLYSRQRPGLNHIAFNVDSFERLRRIAIEAPAHGWSPLPTDRHPLAPEALVVYLEDRDGFEIELVASG